MRLTAFTDYCLRVLVYLAATPGPRPTIAEVAAAFGISRTHLTKVVQHLGHEGWIETTRGRGGGLALAMPAEAISVGWVVRGAEGPAVAASCMDPQAAGDCAIERCCRLKGCLGEAVDAFYAVLDRTTLADVAAHPQLAAGVVQLRRRALRRHAV